jgi:hypothetical protein
MRPCVDPRATQPFTRNSEIVFQVALVHSNFTHSEIVLWPCRLTQGAWAPRVGECAPQPPQGGTMYCSRCCHRHCWAIAGSRHILGTVASSRCLWFPSIGPPRESESCMACHLGPSASARALAVTGTGPRARFSPLRSVCSLPCFRLSAATLVLLLRCANSGVCYSSSHCQHCPRTTSMTEACGPRAVYWVHPRAILGRFEQVPCTPGDTGELNVDQSPGSWSLTQFRFDACA